MPIYMDRHDVSEEVTAENVAHLHQQDLNVQDEFNCRGLTYWFDDKRKTAFCLIEAPNAESVHQMHDHAHGEVPHSIIEVDASVVESFLGRIEDPKGNSVSGLKIISEPAFRLILSMELRIGLLTVDQSVELAPAMLNSKNMIADRVNECQGILVKQDGRHLMASFSSVRQTLECGLILSEFVGKRYPYLTLNLGLDAGVPVGGGKTIFENTIKNSRGLCTMGNRFNVSTMVMNLYRDEPSDRELNLDNITVVGATEMLFFHNLIDYLDANHADPELRIDAMASNLGVSRTQLFRNTVRLSGCSPIALVNRYRLEKSLDMLASGLISVSEAAFSCGFSSSSYYSKCFRKMYGIPPKEYMKVIKAI